MRDLIVHMVEAIPGVKVSGSAQNTAEARMELTRRRPQLVLLDEILPGESSQDLLDELLSEKIRVVLMTGVENPTHSIPDGVEGRLAKPAWDTLDADRQRFEAALLKN